MAAEQTHVLLLLLGGGIYFFKNFSGGVLSFLSAPETGKNKTKDVSNTRYFFQITAPSVIIIYYLFIYELMIHLSIVKI